eukprot:TRINITY_DN1759_c0_g3_i2.p1 TRINITY_DN1759_c0_g3~~TRINITY_DN1759_c0_g3_i2.p1  ORF type:complete len:516 (+),score=105.75 TRINITY_DN1759_c0_g3_i2:768-2315(+)
MQHLCFRQIFAKGLQPKQYRGPSFEVSRPQPRDSIRSKVTVQMKKQVNTRTDEEGLKIQVLYPFQVKIGDRVNKKLEKPLGEFQALEKTLKTYLRGKNLPKVDLETDLENFGNESVSLRRSATRDVNQTIIKALQEYFDHVLKRKDCLCPPLMDFLEIEETLRPLIMNQKIREPQQTFRKERISSFHRDDEDGLGGSDEEFDLQAALRQSAVHSDSHFCLHFDVDFLSIRKSPGGDFYEYIIQITLKSRDNEKWEIIKRYSDFVRLRDALKIVLKQNMPPLPNKNIAYSETNLEKRKLGLEVFLRVLLNEKLYYKENILFAFINLKPDAYECVRQFDDGVDFSLFRAVFKHYEEKREENNHAYTNYSFSIEEHDREHAEIVSRKMIARRFREFVQLHECLEIRFANQKIAIPALPAKYTTFGTRTTPEDRKKGLEQFLNSLMKFPNIQDCFAFRKFINFTVDISRTNSAKASSGPYLSGKSERIDDINSLRESFIHLLHHPNANNNNAAAPRSDQ